MKTEITYNFLDTGSKQICFCGLIERNQLQISANMPELFVDILECPRGFSQVGNERLGTQSRHHIEDIVQVCAKCDPL